MFETYLDQMHIDIQMKYPECSNQKQFKFYFTNNQKKYMC